LVVPGSDLVEGIAFVSDDFLQGENLRSMIGRRRRLCTVSFLEASLLEKLDFWCCLGGVNVAALGNKSLKRDFSFFFVILLLFLAGCNWYLLDVNIYSLSKKNIGSNKQRA
jgi:hypothetical protein